MLPRMWLAQEGTAQFDIPEAHAWAGWVASAVMAALLLVAWRVLRWLLKRYGERVPWRRLRWWIPTLVATPFAALFANPEAVAMPVRVTMAVLNLPALAVVGQEPDGSRWLAGSALSWIVWWLAFYFLEYLAHSRRRIGLELER